VRGSSGRKRRRKRGRRVTINDRERSSGGSCWVGWWETRLGRSLRWTTGLSMTSLMSRRICMVVEEEEEEEGEGEELPEGLEDKEGGEAAAPKECLGLPRLTSGSKCTSIFAICSSNSASPSFLPSSLLSPLPP